MISGQPVIYFRCFRVLKLMPNFIWFHELIIMSNCCRLLHHGCQSTTEWKKNCSFSVFFAWGPVKIRLQCCMNFANSSRKSWTSKFICEILNLTVVAIIIIHSNLTNNILLDEDSMAGLIVWCKITLLIFIKKSASPQKYMEAYKKQCIWTG